MYPKYAFSINFLKWIFFAKYTSVAFLFLLSLDIPPLHLWFCGFITHSWVMTSSGNPQKGTPCHDIITHSVTPVCQYFVVFDHRTCRNTPYVTIVWWNALECHAPMELPGNSICRNVNISPNMLFNKYNALNFCGSDTALDTFGLDISYEELSPNS